MLWYTYLPRLGAKDTKSPAYRLNRIVADKEDISYKFLHRGDGDMMMRAWWYLRADSCCYSSTVWSLLFVDIPCDSASSHANLPAREVLASFLLRIHYHKLEKHVAFLLDLVVGDWFNASSTWLSFTISGLGGSNRIPCSSCRIVGQTRTYCSNSEAYRYTELIATGDLDSLRLVLFYSRRFCPACMWCLYHASYLLPARCRQPALAPSLHMAAG